MSLPGWTSLPSPVRSSRGSSDPREITPVLHTRYRSHPLEQCSRPLSTADTHRDDAVAAAASVELVHQRANEPRAGHPERMPNRYGTAVGVQPLHRQAEAVATI